MMMKIWPTKHHANQESAIKRGLYRRNLIIVLLVTCIPTILIGVSSRHIGVGQLQSEITRTHLLQLQQTSDKVDEMISELEVMTSQWANNPIFGESLASVRYEQSFLLTHDIYHLLLIMKYFNPLISNIRLFIPDQNVFISDDDGIVGISAQDIGAYTKLINHKDSIFLAYDLHPNNQSVSLIYKLPVNVKKPYGAFIIDLNLDEIAKVLKTGDPANQGVAFILQEDGTRINGLKTADSPAATALEANLRQSVLMQTNPSGSFVFSDAAEDYAVAYGRFSPTGWIYVSALPLNELTSPVTFVSKTMIIINIVGLIIAVILSWTASNRIYRPIMRLIMLFRNKTGTSSPAAEAKNEIEFIRSHWEYLIGESDALKSKLKQQLPTLQESFMIQFVNGNLPVLSEKELRAKFEQLGKIAAGRQFFLMLVHLSGLFNASKFFEGDEHLLSFAAANIIDELIEAKQAEVLNFQNLTVGVLLDFPEDDLAESIRAEASELAHKVNATLHETLKIKVTTILTRPTTALKEIPILLENARQTIVFRDLAPHLQVMEVKASTDGEAKLYYPFALENEIVQHMRLGDVRQAMDGVARFIRELQEFDGKEIFVQQGLLQLLGSLRHAMMKSGFNVNGLYADANLYGNLMQIKEPVAALEWFEHRILGPYAEFVLETTKSLAEEVGVLIDRVTKTLESDYDKPISLESVAEDYKVTPYILSKWFKKMKGVNFIDYLTSIRMEKAKELLIGTDMKINDIAGQVGYQPSYFNRTFKKNEGVTPGDYRSKYGQSPPARK